MKHTRKNKRFRKRKQTKRNNYRKKRPTGGGIIPTFEDIPHIGKNGLLLNFNICKNCNTYRENIGFKLNEKYLNTGYTINNGFPLSTEPFDKDNKPTPHKVYDSCEIIYDENKNKINRNYLNDQSIQFLKDNNIKILCLIHFMDEKDGVIIVKSYEEKSYNYDEQSYTYVDVDTASNKTLKDKNKSVGDYKIIELYRARGNLANFRK